VLTFAVAGVTGHRCRGHPPAERRACPRTCRHPWSDLVPVRVASATFSCSVRKACSGRSSHLTRGRRPCRRPTVPVTSMRDTQAASPYLSLRKKWTREGKTREQARLSVGRERSYQRERRGSGQMLLLRPFRA